MSTALHTGGTLLLTLIVVILLIDKWLTYRRFRKCKNKFKLSISIGIISASSEWEQTEDEFMLELWRENERLEARVAALAREKRNLTFFTVLMAAGFLLLLWLRGLQSKKAQG